jgi:diadenosine tetraphosphate (Ap4A) HIT family hydrolase
MNAIYDKNNIFAKIIRGEIPADKFYEDKYCVAFPDISPAAKTHYLVIPKGEFISFDDFVEKADRYFISNFFKSVKIVATKLGLVEGGYRIIFNHGSDANQTVFHFHVHILGGQGLGPLIAGNSLNR